MTTSFEDLRRELGTTAGVFSPAGWVLASFPSGGHVDRALQMLGEAGFGATRMHRIEPEVMVRETQRDIDNAGTLARIGQEFNLVRAHHALAERGYHFLLVHAPETAQAEAVGEVLQKAGAERAQSYGRFIVEELVQHPDDVFQVGESPDRGLDAQTPSGHEAERADRRD